MYAYSSYYIDYTYCMHTILTSSRVVFIISILWIFELFYYAYY